MNNTTKLLDEIKLAKGITSDYALAKALDLPTQRISDYYKGNRRPDSFACLKIAGALGKPLEYVISLIEIDSEKNETRKEAWKRHLKSLGGLAANFMLWVLSGLVVVTLFVTRPAEAAQNQAFSRPDFTGIQIMRVWEEIRRRALAVLNMLNSFVPRYGFSG